MNSFLPAVRKLILVALACTASASLFAATPTSGTVSAGNPATWTGQLKPATATYGCAGSADAACDNFKLTIVPPPADFGPYAVEVSLAPTVGGDWDLQVYGPDGVTIVKESGNGPGQPERVLLLNPPAGVYTVAASPYAPTVGTDGNSYSGRAELRSHQTSGSVGNEPVSYASSVAPAPLGRNAGEPSIGCNWKTGAVMFQSNTQTLRVKYNDCTSPPRADWEDKTAPNAIISMDPILFTDRLTGRTIHSQLMTPILLATATAGSGLGVLTFGCSISAFTDDDGETWIPSLGCGLPAGADHQTVGGGRFHDPLTRDPNLPVYANAVYYCAQSGVTAYCSRSDDGGLTYGAGVPAWNTTQCGGLHGHIKVSPHDGTVYVPNKGCGGQQAVVVSEDNGLTWTVRTIPGSFASDNDPSVAIGNDGTVYIGYQDADGHPRVAVSGDRGASWSKPIDVGVPFNIQNTSFPTVVAGDGDRAAFAFLGTDTPGNFQAADFAGVWYLFVAHTYDRGLTWTTVNATDNDPVQRGCIWLQGGSNPCRNLLDFNDATIDKEGRVLAAYADGCVGNCVFKGPNSYTEVASIARQVNGRRMFAAFDSVGAPSAPLGSAAADASDASLVHISWSAPDDHGQAITGYRIYRRSASSDFSLLASPAASSRAYDDRIVTGQDYFYKLTAVNSAGESTACGEFGVGSSGGGNNELPCVLPGITAAEDGANDTTTGTPERDLRSVSVAGKLTDGNLVFTIKVAQLNSVPANSAWGVRWSFKGTSYYAMMRNCSLTTGPTFDYGTIVTNSLTRIATTTGSYSADGAIRINVPASGIGNPQAGETLASVLGRTDVVGGLQCAGLYQPDDTTSTGSYAVASCVEGTPTARDDAATTEENYPVVINVLANDSDPNGDPLTVSAITQGTNGAVTNNGDGTLTYIPQSNFHGTDSFTYTVQDTTGLTATAHVAVTVNAFCPALPTGRFFDSLEPTPLPGWSFNPAVNNLAVASPTWKASTDPGARSLTQSFFSDATTLDTKDDRLVAPARPDLSSTSQLIFWHRFGYEDGFDGGVLEVSTDEGNTWRDIVDAGGTFVEGGYNGVISGTFGSPIAGRSAWTGVSSSPSGAAGAMTRVVVNLGALTGKRVHIRWRLAADPVAPGALPGEGWWVDDIEFTNLLEVSNCNRPPVANADTSSTVQDTPVTINVLVNDTDPENDPLSVTGITQPAHGSAVNNNNGTVTYTPASGYLGDDSFTYTVSDGRNTASATVTVSVNERPNRVPVANNDTAATTQDTPVTVNVLSNDSDPDGDALTVQSVTQPANGSVNNNGQNVSYSPNPGFAGSDSFNYTASDGRGGTATASVSVTVTASPNAAPQAQNDTATTQQDTAVTINVLANDSDANGDPLTVTAVSAPSHGTAVNNGGGNVTYTPGSGYSGSDSFTYTVSDGRGGTATATVTVMVNAAAEGGKAHGNGTIGSKPNQARLSFNSQAQDGTKGRVSHDDTNFSMKGTITTLSISGNVADFGGACTMGAAAEPCTFTAHAEDNAGGDRYRMQVFNATGAKVYDRDGILSSGNIVVKQ